MSYKKQILIGIGIFVLFSALAFLTRNGPSPSISYKPTFLNTEHRGVMVVFRTNFDDFKKAGINQELRDELTAIAGSKGKVETTQHPLVMTVEVSYDYVIGDCDAAKMVKKIVIAVKTHVAPNRVFSKKNPGDFFGGTNQFVISCSEVPLHDF